MMREAKALAARVYRTTVLPDETTDGETIYVAMNPELKGCIAQGDTVDEAKQNLDETRIDFILAMIEDGLPVPEPQPLTSGQPIIITPIQGAGGNHER